MKYEGFTTFRVAKNAGVMTVTFDFGTVNVQGQEMLADLNSLAMRLERDRKTKVVIFQSANPEIWVCHYDTELLKDMSDQAVSRDEAQLLPPGAQPREGRDRPHKAVVEPDGEDHGAPADPRNEVGEAHQGAA